MTRYAMAYGSNVDERITRLYERKSDVSHSLGQYRMMKVRREIDGRPLDPFHEQQITKLEAEAAELDAMFCEAMNAL